MKAPANIFIALLFITEFAFAQGLPHPSRTVFKCQEGNGTYYSDSPCPGATKVDVTPTRGLNKSTGKELIGTDVRRERNREIMAEALRPLTGKDAEQLDQFGRRYKLPTQAQQQCRKLDGEIPRWEQAERSAATKASLSEVQGTLFQLRKQYRELRCE